MKKTKIVTSLIIIACVIFILGTMSVYADNITPTTITTITTSSGNNTANNTVDNTADNKTNNTTNNTANNSTGGITTIGGTNNTANRVSSYTNNSSTTSQDGLPYTGANYSVIFVIVALVISAVYAYKKITDYNV